MYEFAQAEATRGATGSSARDAAARVVDWRATCRRTTWCWWPPPARWSRARTCIPRWCSCSCRPPAGSTAAPAGSRARGHVPTAAKPSFRSRATRALLTAPARPRCSATAVLARQPGGPHVGRAHFDHRVLIPLSRVVPPLYRPHPLASVRWYPATCPDRDELGTGGGPREAAEGAGQAGSQGEHVHVPLAYTTSYTRCAATSRWCASGCRRRAG